MHTKFYLHYAELSQKEINQSFLIACAYSNTKDIEYLMFSKESPFNAQWEEVKFPAFKISCLKNHYEVLKFLINDMKLIKDFEIEDFLTTHKSPLAEKLFLERDIIKNKNITSKIKI
jgi:hypothetical protein